MNSTLNLVLKLVVICVVAGFCLGLTYSVTDPIIEQLQIDQANENYRALIPGADFRDAVYDGAGIYSRITSVQEAFKGDEIAGWCVNIKATGYKGDINLIVGVLADGALAGIRVGAHEETAGLGSKIAEPAFYEQFANSQPPLTLNQHIDAVTGATISSNAVLNAANTVHALYEDQLSRLLPAA
ncbi:MAG: FMN-binding protein [Peptococcaceae bacterium]|jgi:electron transport complex protein RnfG|nr:FMN-binding protein [Peptococcaceae bacterium]